jgi:hypothetical protein
MAHFDVSVKGQKELDKYLKKIENPNKFFDRDVKRVNQDSLGRLIRITNRNTGTTARSWSKKKIGDGVYLNYNGVKTSDKKYLIVDILNKGRKEVRPKKEGGLLWAAYKSKKDINKLPDFVPKVQIDGTWYAIFKKSKEVKGNKFLDKETKLAIKDLVSLVLRRVKKT